MCWRILNLTGLTTSNLQFGPWTKGSKLLEYISSSLRNTSSDLVSFEINKITVLPYEVKHYSLEQSEHIVKFSPLLTNIIIFMHLLTMKSRKSGLFLRTFFQGTRKTPEFFCKEPAERKGDAILVRHTLENIYFLELLIFLGTLKLLLNFQSSTSNTDYLGSK